MQSDKELIQQCLDNDEQAWHRLVERYARLVYSIARNWGFGEADTEDIAQTVFTILCQRLASLREADRLGSWLITTTRRECWRLNRRRPDTVEIDPRDAVITSIAEADAEQIEEQYLVWQALEELGGQCEQLLRALFSRGSEEGYARIAERLGMEIGSIGPTRARCFSKLERILISLGFGPENSK